MTGIEYLKSDHKIPLLTRFQDLIEREKGEKDNLKVNFITIDFRSMILSRKLNKIKEIEGQEIDLSGLEVTTP